MNMIFFSERMRIATGAYDKALDDLEEYIKKQREELIRIKPANFDKITEYPETLAEFIDEAIERAVGDIGGRGCPIFEHPKCEKGVTCVQCITWWLKCKVEEGQEKK